MIMIIVGILVTICNSDALNCGYLESSKNTLCENMEHSGHSSRDNSSFLSVQCKYFYSILKLSSVDNNLLLLTPNREELCLKHLKLQLNAACVMFAFQVPLMS